MRTSRPLAVVSVTLVVVGLLELAAGACLAQLPPTVERWAWSGRVPPQAERAQTLRDAHAALAGSGAVGWLAHPAARRELAEAFSRFEHAAVAPAEKPSAVEMDVARAVHRVQQSSFGSGVVALALGAVLLLSGLLGLLRLRRRGVWTFVSASLLALASSLLVEGFGGNPLLETLPAVVALLGCLGQVLGTNLLRDSNTEVVLRLERQLRALPAAARARWAMKRALGGVVVAVAAVAATAWSYRSGPSRYFVAYVGALCMGLVISGSALVAWLRAAGPES